MSRAAAAALHWVAVMQLRAGDFRLQALKRGALSPVAAQATEKRRHGWGLMASVSAWR